MKKYILLSLLITTLASCQEKKKNGNATDRFEKSYKEQKDDGIIPENTEHFDSLRNIYSNYKYKVAFDAPDHWASDDGVSKHTIFRTYQPDSAITFAINVIELKDFENSEEVPDIWEFYKKNTEKMDYPYTVLIPKQFNSQVKDFKAKKSYIKNQLSLKRSFNYLVRELDFEYSNTSIVYQTFLDKYTYTFSLDVPTMYYDDNPEFYESMFLNIYFLLNKNKVNQFLNNKGN